MEVVSHMQNIIKEMKIISKEVHGKKMNDLTDEEFLTIMPELVGEIALEVHKIGENEQFEFQLFINESSNKLELIFQYFEKEKVEEISEIPDEILELAKKMKEFKKKYREILDHDEYEKKFQETFSNEDKGESDDPDTIKNCVMSEFRENIDRKDIKNRIQFIQDLRSKAIDLLDKFKEYLKADFTDSFHFN